MQDETTYHGEHVFFERIVCYPKPAQRPQPPILVGGHGPKVLDRVHDEAGGRPRAAERRALERWEGAIASFTGQ